MSFIKSLNFTSEKLKLKKKLSTAIKKKKALQLKSRVIRMMLSLFVVIDDNTIRDL